MTAPRIDRTLARGVARITGSALGPYQTAVVRIGFSFTWLFFLLREWPYRHRLYGPDSTWSWELARRLIDNNGAFTALMWSDSRLWFELVYLLAVLAGALLMLGWRTRAMSVLFMFGVLSLQNRSVFMGDGGDNVIHLMAMYLVLTRCGQVWSLDARRARRKAAAEKERTAEPEPEAEPDHMGRAPAAEPAGAPRRDTTGAVLWSVLGFALAVVTMAGLVSTGWALFFWSLWLVHALWWAVEHFAPGREIRTVLDVAANIVHNGVLLVVMAEVCLVYSTAGWYKIQGSRWQDGTALHYPLNLDYFTPWPALSGLLAGSGVLVMLITYATVITQVAFPFTLFNRRVKNVLLVVMMGEHASIAVVMGLPFFSLAMIAADAVFLPTGFLRATGRYAGRCTARLRGGPPARSRREPVPAERETEGRPRTLVG